MDANKTVNLSQLQAEALALGGTHKGHFLTSTGADPHQALMCDPGTGKPIELCQTGQDALAAHVAKVPAAPPDQTTRDAAIAALKASTNPDTQNIVKVLGL